MNEIIANALNVHLRKHTNKVFSFPDGAVKHLDHIVYEVQKDFSWTDKDDKSKALHYFACNALTNLHLVSHASASKRDQNVTQTFRKLFLNL